MAALQTQPVPDGYEMTPGGLTVPRGMAGLVLNDVNKRLLDTRERTDSTSLEASVTDAYLTAARYDDNGVVRYRTQFDETQATGIATKIIEALAYHINFRHFTGMDQGLVAQLSNIKDPNGRSYAETVVRSMVDVDVKTVAEQFGDKVSLDAVRNMAGQYGKQYLQTVVTESLEKEHGQDLTKYREGILNLNQVFKIAPARQLETSLNTAGLQNLKSIYLQLLEQARSKLN